MISIIICSANSRLLDKVKHNIENTIGVTYEIIAIDNSLNQYSLTEAYNRGAKRASYEFLCFIHEDVRFVTPNWGQKFIDHIKDVKVGAIGVAGSSYKSILPSSWSLFRTRRYINLVQHYKREAKRAYHHCEQNDAAYANVVAIDGVFIGTKKSIWEASNFDEVNLRGFHGYDIDFSLNVTRTHEVHVVFDILLEHYSEGNPDRQWMETAMFISKKWKAYLPVSIGHYTKKQHLQFHRHAIYSFAEKLRMLGYSLPMVVKLLFKYGWQKENSLSTTYYIMEAIVSTLANTLKARRQKK